MRISIIGRLQFIITFFVFIISFYLYYYNFDEIETYLSIKTIPTKLFLKGTDKVKLDKNYTIQNKLEKKKELCEKDYKSSKFALSLIKVTKSLKKNLLDTYINKKNITDIFIYPKILCFVNTISTRHSTRAKSIYDTWGKRCDKLVFLSNVTDESIGAYDMKTEFTDHDHLWEKHKASIIWVYNKYKNDYNWFYKADDDAYVIIDNLKKYLRSPTIMQQQYIKPIQIGRRFSLPYRVIDYYIVDKEFLKEYNKRWNKISIFNSGGPGYVMNKLYMKFFIESMDKWYCLNEGYSRMLPDDTSISFCMAWHNAFPYSSRDLENRERFHFDSPDSTYFNDINKNFWSYEYHIDIGGLQTGIHSCAPSTIAFHYVNPTAMYHLERQLYYCRDNESIDLASYNNMYGIDLPENNVTVFYDNKQK